MTKIASSCRDKNRLCKRAFTKPFIRKTRFDSKGNSEMAYCRTFPNCLLRSDFYPFTVMWYFVNLGPIFFHKTHTHSSWQRLKWVGFIFCMGTYPVATHKMAPECCEMLTFLDSSRQFSRCVVEKHNFCLICEQIIEFGIWEENYGMPKPMRICRNEFS